MGSVGNWKNDAHVARAPFGQVALRHLGDRHAADHDLRGRGVYGGEHIQERGLALPEGQQGDEVAF